MPGKSKSNFVSFSLIPFSANSLVDEMMRPYKNAFSVIGPAIMDSSLLTQSNGATTDVYQAYINAWAMSWAMSSSREYFASRYRDELTLTISKEICECIGDGIRLLKSQQFWLYVPEVDWYNMQQDFGASPMYDHLVTVPESSTQSEEEDTTHILEEILIRYLELCPDEFSPEVPFTYYGLDSLTAGRLSIALKKYIFITAVQLLADVSLADLLKRIERSQTA
jgi:hypothetical protein